MSDWESAQTSSANLRQTYNKPQGPAARATRGEQNSEEKRKEWNENTESEAKNYVIQWLVEASEAVDGGVEVSGGVTWSVGFERHHGGNQRYVPPAETEGGSMVKHTRDECVNKD
ncbi:hypothetical protein B0H16DRAFT_1462212 [Mycena metata]|uniref:Uncharacterized protein n=1 Tax=Mycena metata TaxID=1033252 RepID=A0AAD7IQS9_9AGAR|nr:hypothetical protein B0H16DRAFT_1462212 [Mycena metata]